MKQIQNSDIIPKLRTYKIFKTYFKQENYLSVIKEMYYAEPVPKVFIKSTI